MVRGGKKRSEAARDGLKRLKAVRGGLKIAGADTGGRGSWKRSGHRQLDAVIGGYHVSSDQRRSKVVGNRQKRLEEVRDCHSPLMQIRSMSELKSESCQHKVSSHSKGISIGCQTGFNICLNQSQTCWNWWMGLQ